MASGSGRFLLPFVSARCDDKVLPRHWSFSSPIWPCMPSGFSFFYLSSLLPDRKAKLLIHIAHGSRFTAARNAPLPSFSFLATHYVFWLTIGLSSRLFVHGEQMLVAPFKPRDPFPRTAPLV